MEFTDSKGRVWRPHVTLEAVRNFETNTGIGIFAAVFDALNEGLLEERSDKTQKGEMKAVIGLCKAIFGFTGHMGIFLYESCVSREKRKEVGLSDFCESIGDEQIHVAMVVAIKALLDFFPEVDPEAVKKGGGASKPGDPSPGSTSGDWPAS